jgi:hypothetical protein
MVEDMGLKINLDGISSIQNFKKIYHMVEKLLVGNTQADRHTDRGTGDLISLLSFLESEHGYKL